MGCCASFLIGVMHINPQAVLLKVEVFAHLKIKSTFWPSWITSLTKCTVYFQTLQNKTKWKHLFRAFALQTFSEGQKCNLSFLWLYRMLLITRTNIITIIHLAGPMHVGMWLIYSEFSTSLFIVCQWTGTVTCDSRMQLWG